jgi:hypothetical protein
VPAHQQLVGVGVSRAGKGDQFTVVQVPSSAAAGNRCPFYTTTGRPVPAQIAAAASD